MLVHGQIDRMLLAATVFFCLCVLPKIVFQYTEKSWTAGGSTGANFYLERARHITVVSVATLNVLNHAVNFVLYVLVAQKFRLCSFVFRYVIIVLILLFLGY